MCINWSSNVLLVFCSRLRIVGQYFVITGVQPQKQCIPDFNIDFSIVQELTCVLLLESQILFPVYTSQKSFGIAMSSLSFYMFKLGLDIQKAQKMQTHKFSNKFTINVFHVLATRINNGSGLAQKLQKFIWDCRGCLKTWLVSKSALTF